MVILLVVDLGRSNPAVFVNALAYLGRALMSVRRAFPGGGGAEP